MALFWPLENLTRMRKLETNEDGLNSEYLQILATWNFVLIRLVMINQAKQIFLSNSQIKAVSNKWSK